MMLLIDKDDAVVELDTDAEFYFNFAIEGVRVCGTVFQWARSWSRSTFVRKLQKAVANRGNKVRALLTKSQRFDGRRTT